MKQREIVDTENLVSNQQSEGTQSHKSVRKGES